jgi:hypothetical protein
MMTLLALMRPDSWNYVLLLHVGGAMILTGAVLACASALAFARGDARLLRLGYFTLLAVAVPAWVLMLVGAEWMYSKENLDDAPDMAWTGIGYTVADISGLFILAALIVGGIGVRRLPSGRGTTLLNVTLGISVLLLAAYVVAVWAMSAKPS